MIDTDSDRNFWNEGVRLDTSRQIFVEITKMLDTESGQVWQKVDRLDTELDMYGQLV